MNSCQFVLKSYAQNFWSLYMCLKANNNYQQMEPNFPTLDISLGAYYQLLKENRGRVTRNKAAALNDKKKDQHQEEIKKPPLPPPKPARAPRPKKLKDPEPVKKRSVPEEPEEQPTPKPTPKRLKKLRDEVKPKETKTKEVSGGPKTKGESKKEKESPEALRKYSQKLPDGVFRENVVGRIAFLKRKSPSYVKFVESAKPKGESYIVEGLDSENIRKAKDRASKETISLKQEKVYLILEPAWLCLSFKEPRYQPVLVLLNIGRTDIEDLQLPEQPFPTDFKPHGGSDSTSKQSIFSTEQRVLMMNPETHVMSKCSTDLLFHYNPTLDTLVRQNNVKKGTVSSKLYAELDYLFELNQKWLHDNEEIEVTPENANECLFSEVSFGDKRGVLLNYKKDKKGLCIRVYSVNNELSSPETEWVYLGGAAAPKVSANMLKGRVTLVELENFDPDSPNPNYTPQYKYCEIQEDEEPKPKPDDKEVELKRCKQCNYVIHKLEYRVCGKCGEYYHCQCLSKELQKTGLRDRQWRCMNCARCAHCLSSKGKETLTVCNVCNTGYHTKCMEPDVLNQMPSSNKGKISWKCDKCVKCVGCGSRSAGHSKQSKWSCDYSLCSKCKKRKINNQFCPVCEQIWNSTEEEPMIQCACGMWVHKSCDKSLTDDAFNVYEQSGKEYLCMKCRRNKRNMFIMQIIDILANEDKMQLFHYPVDLVAVPNYTNVIKQPMCFKIMREKASQGIYLSSPETLKSDFELICNNAMLFNMPKTNYYKEAESLLSYGTMILNNNWTTLQKFKTLTQDEENYAKQMVEKKRLQKSAATSPVPAKPKPKVLAEEEKDGEESEEGGKITRKALRKRRLINYSEDQNKDVIENPNAMDITPVVPVPNVPNRKKKLGVKKPQGQAPTLKRDQSVHSERQKEKSEPRPKEDSITIQGYFELLAQREEEASKYLYSNPIVAQFNDPTLCFSEMCSLCGAFGNSEDFIMCVLCGDSYHPYCISLPAGVDLDKLRKYWKCLNCKYCEHCCKATGEDKLLYCDSCDKAYHTYCLVPPLKVIPGCGWKCKECFKCAKCGTQSFFGEHGHATEAVYDYSHTNNFTYCNRCGMEEHDKSFCSICKQIGTHSDNPLANCSVCKRWSHIKCSRITPEQYEELLKSNMDYKCFTCLMKERSSQEIHFEVVCFRFYHNLTIV
eukprot:TRINITY_DN1124_c0_g1_i1.p1 TRINITY_DN1124_c0_g1~~TRINITY_DN1124_c0_g1_i1.p1  ORF type:complete len:1179 (+),score=140.02 TRINITY_DN1124_c0_g1_i1:8642-12178(+)